MAGDDEVVRLAVYRTFATTGRPPTTAELARTVGPSVEYVRASLQRLAQDGHVVLDEDDEVMMAHPFTAIPFGFSVMGENTLWWGACAWDSFAMPHLVPAEPEVLVSTRCPHCGTAHAWVVGQTGPPQGDQVAHFLIPAAHMWDDVVRTCANQRVFCTEACVDGWLAKAGQPKGYVMDLSTLWRLAAHWYEGRLEYGYTGRDRLTATAYFRQVGLSGPFWDL